MNFKTIRITILLMILSYIGFETVLNTIRATDWKRPLRVVIYPINADDSEHTQKYIEQLSIEGFNAINTLLEQQSTRYGKSLSEPVRLSLAPQLQIKPPVIPTKRNGLSVLWWSIKLRFWAWKNNNYKGPKPQIKAYALFFDPNTHRSLQHSTGLKKAKLAINYLFADKTYTKQNNIVLLHELLHTLGATDKYDLKNGSPVFPDGYGDSNQQPLYPQKTAEIMGSRIAISQSKAVIPISLKSVVVGRKTAQEIGWID